MRASLCIEIGMLKLLTLLKDGRFHSGEALGAALGVSRSAVWKQLQLLESELNLTVYKVRGRGYRLASPLMLLDAEQIFRLATKASWPVLIHDEIDSTNAEALRLIASGRGAPFLVLAERQSAGRGRRGRAWLSPFAQNLYYSLVLRVEGGMRQLEGLSLVVGLAVRQTLLSLGVPGAGLKWPNDVLVGNRKVAGILLELVGDPADVCHVVLGIGINVNMQEADIDQAWTSLTLECGRLVDRNQLAALLSDNMQTYLARHREHGFAALQGEWEGAHLWQGRAVSLIAGSNSINGTVLGVDRQGALRLEVDGVEKSFSGGELSLRLRDDS
ncbi:BirA family transcriptional regulator, biotin operon repressor / biotin-[acetyl-CoA-carboxylase] ligase [Pseudomonas japonica]|uniref:Bifunctional ligase/repressor BirA n=2 Tax=Pseudomonas japonica TaxID=256466 RepID=A0A239LYY4_9PSED|nr:BirA family transcriptional regulator, biotin operon repressor / biotin-[acetyl-CoA-carboxylase] ligase [Pseudomonas japonica]